MSIPLAPVEVFYSFAEVDTPFLEQLESHLSPLRRAGTITTWHRREIVAGDNWQVELDRHLNTASLILLLISPDFIASDYCYGEARQAMQRYEANEAQVIPILLRPVDWRNAPFGKLVPLPGNGEPITEWLNRDKAFADIAQGIRIALEGAKRLRVNIPSTLLPGVWTVPHSRNPHFTGRDELLDKLDQYFASTDSGTTRKAALTQPQAIKGLGGIGKTQVAVEYAYRSRDNDRYAHTFWVNAASEETILTSFVELAELLPILPLKNETDQRKLVAAVKLWLEQCELRWLLIFDNADDLPIVQHYLPQRGKGDILLTTRADAVRSFAVPIEVEKMGLMEATQLLLHRAGRDIRALDEEINEATNIVLALDFFPLALDQAGAYIEETQCSLVDYLQIYQTHQRQLLAKRGLQTTNYPDSVATTWSLSFQKVEQVNPAAAELLRLCAFLAPDMIPEELIRDGATEWGPLLQKAAADQFAFNQMIADLLKFSLVKRLMETQALSIHRLVQAVQKDMMGPDMQCQWAERALRAVNKVFPGDPRDITTWPQCLRYLDQAQACYLLVEHYGLPFIEAADLFSRTGLYLNNHALYSIAEPLYQHALSIYEQLLGATHLDTATGLNNLASLYERQGKYVEAELLYQRALAIREHQLGAIHPDTATSLNNLAVLYETQGKYTEAESLYQQALKIYEQQLGIIHPDTAHNLNNLASLYKTQGKYTEAEPLYQRALKIYEQQLGAEHPYTAISLNNLATLYDSQGKYVEAEPLYQRALAAYEQQLGNEHPNIASILNNLAVLYDRQGKYVEAEPLYQRALAIYEQQLGTEHPRTASVLYNLAVLYKTQGKYIEAESLYQQVLTICELQLGAEHPDTASTLNSLAMLYEMQGKYSLAEPLYLRALSIREQQLGTEHPHTASTVNNLAVLYKMQGKYSLAEPLYLRTLSIREQQLGTEHPDTANSLYNLASLYETQSKYALAEPLYQHALAIYEQRLGTEHPNTASTLNNLAILYQAQGKYAKAEPLLKRALVIREQQLGPIHPDTATSLDNLAMLYETQGKYAEAEPLLKRALVIREQQLGATHPQTATSLNNLAMLYETQGKYAEAELLYQRALAICEQQLGATHTHTAISLNNLAALYKTQGKYAEAEPLYQRALTIYEQQLGATHSTTKVIYKNYVTLLETLRRDMQ